MDKDEDQVRFDYAELAAAEKVLGIDFTPQERWLMLERVREQLSGYRSAREAKLDNSLEPALRFDPGPPPAAIRPKLPPLPRTEAGLSKVPPDDELAFLPVTRLARLLRAGAVTSDRLTRLALDRLRIYGPRLRCLVTLTEELALEQARRADQELAAGLDRGILHGIPYGAKDLLAVPGYPTTWGAEPYRRQQLKDTATVVERLEEAGAVLVAKLSLGELAMGDVWFGGMTLSPWERWRGASGSSAGSASAVAAGLVPFAIGSETMGSIVSPATRCGVAALRPSSNRVSRHGAMALAWSLDKLGPICRSVEDCALVLQAIAGPDGKDATVTGGGFEWAPGRGPADLRLGYVAEAFEGEGVEAEGLRQVLERLRSQGLRLEPVSLPEFAAQPIMTALMVEAAAAFDELTREDRDDLLAQQGSQAWPNLLRAARLVPAVEYLQANRLRTAAVRAMHRLFEQVDAYLCPSSHHANLYLTNATGNPAAVVPLWAAGERRPPGASMTVTGRHLGEQEALTVALSVEAVMAERPRPDMEAWA